MEYWGINYSSNDLEHYGVKGMRWRKRKKRSIVGETISDVRSTAKIIRKSMELPPFLKRRMMLRKVRTE